MCVCFIYSYIRFGYSLHRLSQRCVDAVFFLLFHIRMCPMLLLSVVFLVRDSIGFVLVVRFFVCFIVVAVFSVGLTTENCVQQKRKNAVSLTLCKRKSERESERSH